MNKDSYKILWIEQRERMSELQRLAYKTLPEERLINFEEKNGIRLPVSYRTFLLYFGSGSPEPNKEILDFKYSVEKANINQPFEYGDTIDYEDSMYADDYGGYRGLVIIARGEYLDDFYIELNGPNPGTIWHIGEYELKRLEDFKDWYFKMNGAN